MSSNQVDECTIGDAMGQAYQVISILADQADILDHPDVQRALDYFAANQYQEDFLPFSIRSAPSTEKA